MTRWARRAAAAGAPRRGRVALALAGALLLAAAPASGQAPEDPPVVHPDLAPLEAEVQAQLRAGQERLAALRREPAPTAAALGVAYGELGRVYHAYALREPAEACYRNARRLLADEARWAHYLAALLQEAGRAEAAVAAWRAALALGDPATPAAWVHLGETLRLLHRLDEAEEAARAALAREPGAPAATALLGQIALARGAWAEAARHLGAALAAVPEATRLHYLLAQAYRGLGEKERAAEHLALAGAVGLRPADPLLDELAALRSGERVHLARGKTAFEAGDARGAADAFRRALAARPESVEARVNLAATLTQLGQTAEAVALLREAVRLEPANATARFNLGWLLGTAGSWSEAQAHFEAALAARPDDAVARRFLAHALRESGQLELALAAYGRAVELAPGDEQARLEEAETLVRLGRLAAARDRLEAGLTLQPRSGLLAHGLARLLAAAPDLALRDGARALELARSVFAAAPSPLHATTVALALAEIGECAQAADWQRRAIAAADPAQMAAWSATLAAYERGAPCRPPGG
jgi:tetratricopeptide (TPR) repeat protein